MSWLAFYFADCFPLTVAHGRHLITKVLVKFQCWGCRYKTSQEEDDAVVADPAAGPREKVAARLLRIEKSILSGRAMLPRHQ